MRRAGIVEQQEGTHGRSLVAVEKQRAHRKPVAYPMRAGSAVYRDDLLHDELLGRATLTPGMLVKVVPKHWRQ
jgi:hypothetical protein